MELIMGLPADLTAWTYDTVLEIVTNAEFEPGQFDYKSALIGSGDKPAKEELNESICRTVCSMANTDGGFILFGVRDRRSRTAQARDRIIGIELGGDLRKQFGDKITKIQPEVRFDTVPKPIVLPQDDQRGIFVVRVPLSPVRPHMFAGVFYRRGDGGSAVAMSRHEVRDQMLLGEDRLQKVLLIRLELNVFRQMAQRDTRLARTIGPTPTRYDTGYLKQLIAGTSGLYSRRLLGDLLNIVGHAEYINQTLDAYRYGEFGELKAGDDDWLAEKHLEMDRRCAHCGQQLERLFGPLTSLDKDTGSERNEEQ